MTLLREGRRQFAKTPGKPPRHPLEELRTEVGQKGLSSASRPVPELESEPVDKETEAPSREGPCPRSRRRKWRLESSFPDEGRAALSLHGKCHLQAPGSGKGYFQNQSLLFFFFSNKYYWVSTIVSAGDLGDQNRLKPLLT